MKKAVENNGTFYVDVKGRVVDEEGEPWPGLNVRLKRQRDETDEMGRYGFEDVYVRKGDKLFWIQVSDEKGIPQLHPEPVDRQAHGLQGNERRDIVVPPIEYRKAITRDVRAERAEAWRLYKNGTYSEIVNSPLFDIEPRES